MLTTANPSVFFSRNPAITVPRTWNSCAVLSGGPCDEYPEETETEEQRDMLAKAIFTRYQRGLSERDLVTWPYGTLH